MAASRVCSISDCGKPYYARSLCKKHYLSARYRDRLPPRLDPKMREGAQFVQRALATDTDECILWPYAKVTNGYGITTINGKSVTTHRYVCEQRHGPSSLFALHRCGVPACINPNHIRWGTPKENTQDCKDHGTLAVGERSGPARLKETQVRAIKQRLKQPLVRGDLMALAREYDVDKATILDIKQNRTWRHVILEGE